MRLKNLSIRTVLVSSALVLTIAILTLSSSSYIVTVKALKTFVERDFRYESAHEITSEMVGIALDVQRLSLSSILRQDSAVLEKIPAHSMRFHTLTTALAGLTGDSSPKLLADIRQLQKNYDLLLAETLNTCAAFFENAGAGAASLQSSSNHAERFIQELYGFQSKFMAHVNDLHHTMIDDFSQRTLKLRLFFVSGLLMLIATLAYIIRVKLYAPLNNLVAFSHRILTDKNALSHRFIHRSNDEFGVLSNSLNTMLANLQQTTVAKEKLLEEIAVKTLLETQLKQQMEASENASKSKSEFLANMSHEIRTPLNAILGFIDILSEQEKGNPQTQHYLKVMESSGKNLLGVINDILDFSKIESGKLELEHIDFNLHEELQPIAELFKSKCRKQKIRFNFHMNDPLPHMLVSDPLRIKQIAMNLLSNAVKFTPERGVIDFEVLYEADTQRLFISVKDTGIGIPEEKRDDIFQAFAQADTTTTRQYGGTGLGLAISSQLVSLLGGELHVESRLGEGSRFFFSIPVETGSAIIPASAALYTGNFSGKILLVEDNEATQMFMSVMLKKLGLAYDIAHNGAEAVDMFKTHRYDIILMDENMPVMNGIEATRQILAFEEEEKRPHTPIVALTANALKGDRERFLAAGMDDYLSKPLERDAFVITFQRLVSDAV